MSAKAAKNARKRKNQTISSWNLRVIRYPIAGSTEVCYGISEVYYNQKKPSSMGQAILEAESKHGLCKLIKRIKLCFGKPILDYSLFTSAKKVVDDSKAKTRLKNWEYRLVLRNFASGEIFLSFHHVFYHGKIIKDWTWCGELLEKTPELLEKKFLEITKGFHKPILNFASLMAYQDKLTQKPGCPQPSSNK